MYRIYTVILFEDLRYITREESRYTGERIYESSSDWNGNRDDRACSWNNFLSLTNLVATITCGGNAFKCSFVCLFCYRVEHRPFHRTYSLPPQLGHTSHRIACTRARAHARKHTHHTYMHAYIHTYTHGIIHRTA